MDARDAGVIHDYATTVVVMPAEHAVARVGVGDHTNDANRMLAVVRWLIEQDFPAPRPLDGLAATHIRGRTITFWRYYHQPVSSEGPPLDSAALGELVRRLHSLPEPPVKLPTWRPLLSLEQMVSDSGSNAVLSPSDRSWLLTRIPALRAELERMDMPLGFGLIHGDAWAGNLMVDPARHTVLLGDWDSIAFGPREVDLVPSWHAARRYRNSPTWATRFADRYGYDLSSSPAFDLLMEMRDFVQLSGPLRHAAHSPRHATALRQRLDGTRARDTHHWYEF
ncbi:aminoglycoside phosphotransferase family protein [Saccharothrix sp.]|uniref:aminoglycoside phosphotransferase family protein n=1 Tax=Saccharothrix sp. TaxID=1873460 RepID=UPI002811E678|nr:aminoglycoside phosphotransferase family protein [Saccharothrix sp.]